MFNYLQSSDSKQALRMHRHLTAVLSMSVFTLITQLFFYNDLFTIDKATFNSVLIFFWFGVAVFTLTFRLGFNELFSDPSLTVAQLLWATCFLLTISYLLNEWRGLALMAYFGMLSFGYFKLKPILNGLSCTYNLHIANH